MVDQSFGPDVVLNSGSTSGGKKLRVGLLGMALFFVSSFLAVLMLKYGIASFFLILCGIAALPIIYTIVAYPQSGILLLIMMSYLIMYLGRFRLGFPFGTLMDGVEVLLIISFFLRQKFQQNWSFMKDRTTVVVLIWIGYNLLEVVNPWADSRLAWLYTVRPTALVALTYFLFEFFIKDIKFIRTLIKLWIGLSIIVALYGLKQEYFGFTKFEQEWLDADPLQISLFFIGNHWRKFSIFSDPVNFAYNMVIASLLCFSLMTGPLIRWKKVVLGLLACLFFYAMLYSGTRGAYVLYPIAFGFYGILKYNRKLLIAGVMVGMVAGFLILMPTSNYTLYRFQTAFKPDKDPSYILRKNNQHKIQPFIQTHPMGGGMGSTGIWGKRFSPYSQLANFPPDSGYVRVAVELGWVGLLLYCTMIFVVLKIGIVNYFAIRNSELKSYCLAMLLILFALNIGNFPQEALVQYPINVYFYLAIALLNVTMKLDKEEQAQILKQSKNN
jgi:hypothetical protein